MFGADDIVAFPGGDVVFIVVVAIIYIAAIYAGRNFIKKV